MFELELLVEDFDACELLADFVLGAGEVYKGLGHFGVGGFGGRAALGVDERGLVRMFTVAGEGSLDFAGDREGGVG